MVEQGLKQLTDEERELYDRQIRLWGVESQKQLRVAHVLVMGMNGVAAEIVKNIVLSGVNSVTLMDSEVACEKDIQSQFLIPRDHIGKNRAEASAARTKVLNPLVTVHVETSELSDKPLDFLAKFDCVVATGLSLSQASWLDHKCRAHSVKLVLCDVVGLFGFMLTDLLHHEFLYEKIINKEPIMKEGKKVYPPADVIKTQGTLKYPSFEDALEVDFTAPENTRLLRKLNPGFFVAKAILKFRDEKKRDVDSSSSEDFAELRKIALDYASSSNFPTEKVPEELIRTLFVRLTTPSCAVVGGLVGQEVIRILSGYLQPVHNMLVFDPLTSCASILTLGC